MTEPPGQGLEEDVDRHGAFPRLTDDQRLRLRGVGTVRTVRSGDVLFREGDEGRNFFVVESGAVVIVAGYGAENRVVAVHGPHRFLGELSLLTGAPLYTTAVVRDDGEVIQVPAERLRGLVMHDQELGDLVLRAFLRRRARMIGRGTGLRLLGSRFTSDMRRLREFLARNRQPYTWMDIENDPDADALLRALGVQPDQTPVVFLPGGDVLHNPSNGELAARIGLSPRGSTRQLCDLMIVGGGPAGLAAALYGASEGLETLAIDTVAFGGQASTSSRIENYLGFPAGISGSELTERAALQARKFGARLVVPAEAAGFSVEDGNYAVALRSGEVVVGRTIIVATGARYRKLDVPELARYEGVGVYYAATQVEAQMAADQDVVIVGGGNSAGQAAMFLSGHAASCHLLIRGSDLAKSMSRYLVDELEANERVTVRQNSEIVELRGEPTIEAAIVRNTRDGQRTELSVQALFVFIGASPNTDWLRDRVAMDHHGFLLTGRDIESDRLAAYGSDAPLFLETSAPGVFAVGDVRSGSIKRVASAVGEGSMAVRLVHQRLASG